MKLGVFTNLLGDRSLDEALAYFSEKGIQTVEIGCGGYPGKSHADPKVLLKDDQALKDFQETLKKYNLTISALSCHGNPVHPQKEVAQQFDADLRDCILLAEKLGVNQINTFSGCPGDHEGAHYPNWVTCAWPDEYLRVLEYQWNDVLIPYWKAFVGFAKAHGVTKIALEPHPGFAVYNTHTLLKLREAVGPEIGANLDPSHLFWQGMDPVAVIRELKGAIFHFHAKDTYVDPYNKAINGVLDTIDYGDYANRSWTFRSVGYGQSTKVWKDIMSALRMVGYDHAISIEHEDPLMSQNEGLTKAIECLKECMTFEALPNMWWV